MALSSVMSEICVGMLLTNVNPYLFVVQRLEERVVVGENVVVVHVEGEAKLFSSSCLSHNFLSLSKNLPSRLLVE